MLRHIRKFVIGSTIWLILLLSKLMIMGFPLKRFQWLIGRPLNKQNEKWNQNVTGFQKKRAWKTGRIIERASKKTCWRSVCLDQALAAAIVFRLLKIPFRFHLGLMRQDKLKAHAWISCGELIVTGRHNKNQFSEISVFAK